MNLRTWLARRGGKIGYKEEGKRQEPRWGSQPGERDCSREARRCLWPGLECWGQ